MTTPIPEVVARLAKYEALKRGDPNGSLYSAYPDAEEWVDAVKAHCADLRTLLADHASLTAERDRLAGALEGIIESCTGFPSGSGMNEPDWEPKAPSRRTLRRARAALTQPEHREEIDD